MMENNPILNYNDSEKAAYLVLLASVATSDHENSQEEIAFMQQMCAVSDISASCAQEVTEAMQRPASVDFNKHIGALRDSDLRFSLIADVINMVDADGDMDANEQAHVAKLNSALNIDQNQFDVMREYVQKANANARQQEATPGLGFLGGNDSATSSRGIGDMLGTAAGFLAQSGLLNKFQQNNIPTNNFNQGSTMGTILSGLATAFIQSKLTGGNQNTQSNSGGGMLGGLVGSMLGGGSSASTSSSGGGDLGSLLSSVMGSSSGQSGLGSIVGQMMNQQQQGQGLPNLSDILGGGGKPAQNSGMGSLIGSLLGG